MARVIPVLLWFSNKSHPQLNQRFHKRCFFKHFYTFYFNEKARENIACENIRFSSLFAARLEKTRRTTQQATSCFLGQLSFDRWTCEMNRERLNANVTVESARVGWGRKARTIPLTLQSTVIFCLQLQLLSRTIFAIVVMLFYFSSRCSYLYFQYA